MRFRLPKAACRSRHRIELPGTVLDVTILHRHAPVLSKTLGMLNELDLVADNLPSPSAAGVFLLNQGVVLNGRYIEKLTALAQSSGREVRVPVIEPSPLARFFCLGQIPGPRGGQPLGPEADAVPATGGPASGAGAFRP
jgi:hypothetical protein